MNETEKRKQVLREMQKRSEYGQFKTENCVTGGWFVWLMDAVDVALEMIKKEKK